MKRCPQCQFIYPDSDELCDFDKTPLVSVDDATIDKATADPTEQIGAPVSLEQHKSEKPANKLIAIAAAVGLVLGLTIFGAYQMGKRSGPNSHPAGSTTTVKQLPVILTQPTPPTVAPSPSPSPTANETVSPKPTPSPTRSLATAHSTMSTGPVSTSSPEKGTKPTGKPVIILSTGGRLEADEVWRTKEGIWYRKDGLVTLLKPNRVKSVVNK